MRSCSRGCELKPFGCTTWIDTLALTTEACVWCVCGVCTVCVHVCTVYAHVCDVQMPVSMCACVC